MGSSVHSGIRSYLSTEGHWLGFLEPVLPRMQFRVQGLWLDLDSMPWTLLTSTHRLFLGQQKLAVVPACIPARDL